MSQPSKREEPGQEAAVSNYGLLCLSGLVAVFLVLLRRQMGLWSLLPVAVGLLGVGLRWRIAPLLCLILITGLLYAHEPGFTRFAIRVAPRFNLWDWLLCGAVLAYFAGHYRLLGLTQAIFPLDSRRPPPLPANPSNSGTRPPSSEAVFEPSRVRDPHHVSGSEITWLILSLPIWPLLAQVCFRLLPSRLSVAGLPPTTSRAIVAAWLLTVGAFITAGLLRYAGFRRMTRQEAFLVVQDSLWQETWRDQGRVSRSLAEMKRRTIRKEEP